MRKTGRQREKYGEKMMERERDKERKVFYLLYEFSMLLMLVGPDTSFSSSYPANF